MTLSQTNSIQNLSDATAAFVRTCLVAKLSLDFPDELTADFDNVLKIVDTHGLEINDQLLKNTYDGVTALVEKKYPELGKRLVELAVEIITNEVLNDRKS